MNKNYKRLFNRSELVSFQRGESTAAVQRSHPHANFKPNTNPTPMEETHPRDSCHLCSARDPPNRATMSLAHDL